MRHLRFVIVPAAIAVCGFVSACSYHKTVETAPERVVTTEPVIVPAPAPATVVQTVPAPPTTVVQTVPVPATSSSTTTTTTSDNGLVEKQKTTTYTTPGY
jgi:multidrug efflux pump subunit AcrA (membrane-fusion protein)